MNAKQLYRGVVVPMVTPVTIDLAIDKEAVRRIIRTFVANGIHPLLMGTTGEGQSVSTEAAIELIKTVKEEAGDKLTIYVALTGTVVSEQYRVMKPYADAGADVLVATLPSYYALTEEQIYNYYDAVATASPVPFMLYNIASTTHMSIPVDVIKRLAENKNVVGIKDSENNDERMKAVLAAIGNREDFVYFCGCAANSAIALERGAVGIVPSGGNYIPEMYNALFNAAISGDKSKAQVLQLQTGDICKIYQKGFTLGESLAALKYMMSFKGICSDNMMPPLSPLTAAQKAEVRSRLEQAGLL
jgi:4-hydroxy-tetrahydrodipicolinate synthase